MATGAPDLDTIRQDSYVAVIGFGPMGRAMTHTLLTAGYPVRYP